MHTERVQIVLGGIAKGKLLREEDVGRPRVRYRGLSRFHDPTV